MNRTQRLLIAPQNQEEWQKYFIQHKSEYLRKRLRAIKLCWEGFSQTQIMRKLGCSQSSLHRWIDAYLAGGFAKLLGNWQSGRTGKSRLTDKHKKILRFIIVYKTPLFYGYNSGTWTIGIIVNLLNEKWNISLKKSQVQEILTKDLDLSYQKFHRDYKEANKGKQKAFINNLNEELAKENQDVVWFDEFSLSTKTDASYGWAPRNSSPKVASSEKKENAKMYC